MAKIKIEADTETMTITCTVDGEELTNLQSVSLYQYPETSYSKPKLEFSAYSMEKKENGVTKTIYVYADKLEKQIISEPDTKLAIAKFFEEKICKSTNQK